MLVPRRAAPRPIRCVELGIGGTGFHGHGIARSQRCKAQKTQAQPPGTERLGHGLTALALHLCAMPPARVLALPCSGLPSKTTPEWKGASKIVQEHGKYCGLRSPGGSLRPHAANQPPAQRTGPQRPQDTPPSSSGGRPAPFVPHGAGLPPPLQNLQKARTLIRLPSASNRPASCSPLPNHSSQPRLRSKASSRAWQVHGRRDSAPAVHCHISWQALMVLRLQFKIKFKSTSRRPPTFCADRGRRGKSTRPPLSARLLSGYAFQ